MQPLPDKWLTVDPGEDTGWSLWSKDELLDSGTEKMWVFGDSVWQAAFQALGCGDQTSWIDEPLGELFTGIELVVVENWTIYPKVAREGGLDHDECRTARLIGSIYQACRLANWDYAQQGALIKDRAIAAGAENFFSKPLHENRHANDAIMHGVFYAARRRNEPWADLSKKDIIVDV